MRKTALTERDLDLLVTLIERRCESLAYLQDRFFGGVRKTAINRLRRLELAGYVSRELIKSVESPDRFHSVYTLGHAARAALLNRDEYAHQALRHRRWNLSLRDSSMPHAIATNRVGDWLGARMIPEHLLTPHAPDAQRHRPDAVYRAAQPDSAGRQLVFLEVDLGWYNRQRILGKVDAFLSHPDARSILFVTNTPERAEVIGNWIRAAHGDTIMRRIQPLTFAQVREGGWLDPGTEPTTGEDVERTAA
jgi:hypothetical protein